MHETILWQILDPFTELFEVGHTSPPHGSNAQIVVIDQDFTFTSASARSRSDLRRTLVGPGATSSRGGPAFVNRHIPNLILRV
jgi:hypothetical protein